MVVFIAIGLIFLGLLIHMMLPAYHRHRMAAELRHDWWPRFERDLRDYTSQRWRAAREAERHL
jgi:hypothetical protein